jgi:hypothetical protein
VEEATRRFTKLLQARARAEKRKVCEKAYAARRAEIDKAYAPRRAEINKAYAPRRAEIDNARGPRPSGRRINNRPAGGMIVGVDLEGVNLGAHFILDDKRFKTRISLPKSEIMKLVEAGETVYRDQRACMAIRDRRPWRPRKLRRGFDGELAALRSRPWWRQLAG